MLLIRRERPEDITAVRRVNEHAFGRPQEANLVDALRAGGKLALSLVAEDDGQVVGHILFSPVAVESWGNTFEEHSDQLLRSWDEYFND